MTQNGNGRVYGEEFCRHGQRASGQWGVAEQGFDMIIRDGDRLLHDVEAASANVMSSCSSRLSNCTAGSSRTAFTAAHTAFSRSRATTARRPLQAFRTAGHSFEQADGIAVGQGHADRACAEDDVDAHHARDTGAHNDDDEDEHVM
ncbi:hypothetical protein GOP47_0024927 [Adiantum capillus-veneris]|uniref:Uncharacterized protein n=1 Tax=Adiantum capillus-veneris TaxID=13818 RepID=A0A9D4U3P9_ADICA|nr:hypothetical protein GOP47_0024927 [Adiantum capillus-veneris]